jgi:ribosomal protein L11 methyltransferase
MSDYILVEFNKASQEKNEILIALLSQHSFNGFEEKDKSLNAFILKEKFDRTIVEDLSKKMQIEFRITTIEEENWNHLWESSFDPVIIGSFCAIRAGFHPPVTNVKHEIIITPKMSFGTGHHATTFMMIEQMQHIDFLNKTVLDFGTGSGILAILSEKLGADKIVAIDQDDLSIENAKENFLSNSCFKIDLKKGSSPICDDKFDIILANIDKNVIVRNLPGIVSRIKKPGVLLLSGLLSGDQLELLTIAFQHQLIMDKKIDNNGWISLKFRL